MRNSKTHRFQHRKEWCLSRIAENALGTVFAVKGGNLMNCGAVVWPCAEHPSVVNGMKTR